jgi:hypothetical protein
LPVRKACLQFALAAAEERTDALLALKCLLQAGQLLSTYFSMGFASGFGAGDECAC